MRGKGGSIFSSFPASFAGQSVDNTALLVKYTYAGDTNLDGRVNLQDFNRLAAGFGPTERRWSAGNSDFDGDVDLHDFNRLAGNFSRSGLAPDGLAGGRGEGSEESTPSLEDLIEQTTGGATA